MKVSALMTLQTSLKSLVMIDSRIGLLRSFGQVPLYAVIKDIRTNKPIYYGRVIGSKEFPMHLFSFDRVLFFRLEGSSLYDVIFSREDLEIKCDNEVPSYYSVMPYRLAKTETPSTLQADCYVENTSLDEEVKTIVYAISKVEGACTVGSCSGHGDRPMFVNIQFTTLASLNFILRCLEDFKSHFRIATETVVTSTVNANKNYVILALVSESKGSEAFGAANALADSICCRGQTEGVLEDLELDSFGFPAVWK